MSTAEQPPRLPRWAKLTLILSLALNLAVAGIVAGHFLRGAPEPRDASINLPIDGFRNIARAMPEADREALRADWQTQSRHIRGARRALRENRAAFLSALRAEPFSPEALESVLAEQAATWQDFGTKSRQILVQRINAMSPESRATFADTLEASLKRRRPSGPPAPKE